MKNLLPLLAFALGAALSYVIVAFILWDWSMATWPQEARVSMILFVLVIGVPAALLTQSAQKA